MTEKLFQFIWQFQYFNKAHLKTIAGEDVSIIQQGKLNKNQGPDFTEAKIRIGNTTFAGSVELHLKTSDWRRHGHDADANYNNVILHVVFENDLPQNGIPVLELQPLIPNFLLSRYNELMNAEAFIPCSNSIYETKELTWASWKERLLVERLTRKSAYVLQLFGESNAHWEESFWWLLARNFGSRVNAEAFEAVARSIPVNILAKHKTQILQLEALLFGQANLLQGQFNDHYPQLLQRESRFLQNKYKLRPTSVPVHFLRMRPGNFPTIRLAQLSALIASSSHLFSRIIETKELKEVQQLFDVTANDYWHYHYNFDEPSAFKHKKLGAEMVSNILINTVVPVLFSYGVHHKEEQHKEKAVQWLQEVSGENNSIIKGFAASGIASRTAFDTQALIELKNEYCSKKRCLECAVGNSLLKKHVSAISTGQSA